MDNDFTKEQPSDPQDHHDQAPDKARKDSELENNLQEETEDSPPKKGAPTEEGGQSASADESIEETPEGEVSEVDRLKADLLKLEEQLQEAQDKHLRSIAEMDNMRKRSIKERADLLKYGNENLMSDLLPMLDSFEKSLQESAASSENIESFQKGMSLIHKQLFAILEKHGLKVVESVGKPFDPNLHQAIQRVEMEDVDEDIVKDEYSRGYTLNDRLLRPSMVVVAAKAEQPSHEAPKES